MNRGVPAEIRAMVYTGHHGGAVANRPTDFSAPVAQGIEQRFPKPLVACSNQAGGTID